VGITYFDTLGRTLKSGLLHKMTL